MYDTLNGTSVTHYKQMEVSTLLSDAQLEFHHYYLWATIEIIQILAGKKSALRGNYISELGMEDGYFQLRHQQR